ncbi:DUF4440 domain-containing protein [Nocardia niwae]|uniref:DUF4440 domain-containing protein n=1 Tax=Nocardia niwae TaxID=626084 RepID=UPI0033F62332
MDVDLVDVVERLHADLARWFGSAAPVEVFERFAAAQHEQFSMVTTAGEVLDRSALLTGVRDARNAMPGLTIEVADIEELSRAGGLAVVRFLETHRAAGNVTRRRVTAVLTTENSGAVRWLTVHETDTAPA